MPGKRSGNRKNKGKATTQKSLAGASKYLTTYNGPLLPRGAKQGASYREIVVAYQLAISSSAGGVINNVAANDPSISGDWANVQATAAEYRILMTEWSYYPNNKYNRTATTVIPGYRIIDRSGNGALVSTANATNHDSVKFFTLDEPWKMTARMDGIDESGFIQIAGASAPYAWLKLFASGESISTQYGQLLVRIRIQLKSTE